MNAFGIINVSVEFALSYFTIFLSTPDRVRSDLSRRHNSHLQYKKSHHRVWNLTDSHAANCYGSLNESRVIFEVVGSSMDETSTNVLIIVNDPTC